jgi:hypothetical protein
MTINPDMSYSTVPHILGQVEKLKTLDKDYLPGRLNWAREGLAMVRRDHKFNMGWITYANKINKPLGAHETKMIAGTMGMIIAYGKYELEVLRLMK